MVYTDLDPVTPERLERFRALLEKEQREELIRKGYNPENHRHACTVKLGKKYARVDVGDSGKYMVDLADSKIWGIKAYGVIHRGHYYGTLDTISGCDWSGYTATPRREGHP